MMTPAERTRRWAEKHPERARAAKARYNAGRGKVRRKERHLQQTYGLSLQAFAVLLAGQDGKCGICKTSRPNAHGWCVDHDHVTNKVRGILCHSCNSAVGHLKDDPTVVDAAAAYLRRHRD